MKLLDKFQSFFGVELTTYDVIFGVLAAAIIVTSLRIFAQSAGQRHPGRFAFLWLGGMACAAVLLVPLLLLFMDSTTKEVSSSMESAFSSVFTAKKDYEQVRVEVSDPDMNQIQGYRVKGVLINEMNVPALMAVGALAPPRGIVYLDATAIPSGFKECYLTVENHEVSLIPARAGVQASGLHCVGGDGREHSMPASGVLYGEDGKYGVPGDLEYLDNPYSRSLRGGEWSVVHTEAGAKVYWVVDVIPNLCTSPLATHPAISSPEAASAFLDKQQGC